MMLQKKLNDDIIKADSKVLQYFTLSDLNKCHTAKPDMLWAKMQLLVRKTENAVLT